ncbi:hypothetical protein CcaverHIS002_0309610 [Cutaneotrichosporon cavernicola]|uniref:Uncharacterized protein n=1 Tax=Cutaneotrichosporon cavernicola TaxID=279322 RepID=A0AA48L273_9TREE|nr:uncharacterized protein CcaverHIS019_0309450 [Cutaneotrichosporon cavernicola]BEI83093.1 hypothetical protein CcaverHIS002_0309610 [Cutaneotrichosporon cavernicola]BEI90875.1 hypothetical protein CcaverHIS019_0309450 [Cutaneotrichosporon cavernicola]
MPVAQFSSVPHTAGGGSSVLASVSSAPAALPNQSTPLRPLILSPDPTLEIENVLHPPSPTMSASSGAPSTPWSSRFFFDVDAAPGLSPSLSPGFSRCTSEPPSMMPEMGVRRRQRSRSASRTPSSPPSGGGRGADLKSLPVTPKVASPAQINIGPAGPNDDVHLASEPALPCRPQPGPVRHRAERRALLPHTMSSDALGLRNKHGAVPLDSAPVTPDERMHGELYQPTSVQSAWSNCYGSAAWMSTQYSDLFLLEPHEYDSITDGELVRLFDRGVIDGRVLEQIVDASIRIQRAVTDADRAVSIKTRRAMIRHALED